MNKDHLPDDLLWAEGGHASDVVFCALADGQSDIVPAKVQSHVDGCRACTMQLGAAALLSLHAGREIAHAKAAPAKERLPRLAISLGLAVAVLGLLPSLFDIDPNGAVTWATHDAPALVKGATTLLHRFMEPGGSAGLVASYGGAAMLVVMALVFVRMLPKKEVSR